MQPNSQLPADTTIVKEVDPWYFHVSRSDFAMYVETRDYHTGPLRLSLDDLRELVKLMEETKEQVKREVTTSLQNNLRQMIADDPGKRLLEGSKVELIISE